MKQHFQKRAFAAAVLLGAFALWTAAVCHLDVQPIGPRHSSVGFAALNGFVHQLTGVHMALYTLTDWLGLIPLAFMLGFAILGLAQLLQRKHLRRVDHSLFVLGGFYLLVMASYFFFESFVINYRPILIEGYLEASYPSSTTLLVLCVIPTAMMQLTARLRRSVVRQAVLVLLTAFMVLMVVGRLVSGVHWLTDIIGSVLLSAGLVMTYAAAANSAQ